MPEDRPPGAKTRAQVLAAEIDAARRRAGLVLPDGAVGAANRVWRRSSEWALAELAPGRLMPWLPVRFGLGIVVYNFPPNGSRPPGPRPDSRLPPS
jgi:hypothetical protein